MCNVWISGDVVCCSVVCGTLVGVVLSIMGCMKSLIGTDRADFFCIDSAVKT